MFSRTGFSFGVQGVSNGRSREHNRPIESSHQALAFTGILSLISSE